MTSRFVPLHLHTETSFLDATCRPKTLATRAKELDYPAVVTTDHGNVHNFIRVFQACKAEGLKFIPGCEFYFTHRHKDKQDKSNHLTILAQTNEGLKNLYRMLTWANIPVDDGGGFYRKPRISWRELKKYNEGLICLTGCMSSPVNRAFLEDGYQAGLRIGEKLQRIFNDRLFVELQLVPDIPEHTKLLKLGRRMAKDLQVPGVATNDCHYIMPEDKQVHDVVKSIDKSGLQYRGNEYYMKSEDEMLKDFSPDEVYQSGKIAASCNVEIPLKKSHMPKFDSNLSSEAAYDMLVEEVKKGWKFWKIGKKKNHKEYKRRLKLELADIKEAELTDYFLIVWDVMKFVDEHNIGRGFSRGSAGGSLVALLLKISLVDPIEYGLIWERFWNRGRKGSMPDIDLDIDPLRRDEVIEYLRTKFGRNKVFPMMTITKLTAKAAVKDVGRAVGLRFNYMNALTKKFPHKFKDFEDALGQSEELALAANGEDEDVLKWKSEIKTLRKAWKKSRKRTGKRDFQIEGRVVDLQGQITERSRKLIKTFQIAKKLEGTARQRSKHACAILISDKPVFGRIPLTWDTKHKSLVTGFDMYDVEKMGYLKLDVLGLANATVVSRILPRGAYDILDLGFKDKKTYKIIGSGNTKGVFQFEKHLGVDWCKKMRPKDLEEIAALSAILRPGPLSTGLSAKYLKNRATGRIEYIHEDLKPIFGETYGVMVFQEQMLEVVKKFAGFDLARADMVRKACGKKLPEEMAKQKQGFVEGCLGNGYTQELAEQLWEWIEAQAGYSFNKSHAVGYGMMTYATAYLKAQKKKEFFNVLLQLSDFGNNNQRSEISELFYDAKLFGVSILGPSLEAGNEDFEIVDDDIRFGLRHIRDIGNSSIQALQGVKGANWTQLIAGRKGIKKPVLKALIYSGALDYMGLTRLEMQESIEFADKLTPREVPILDSLLGNGKSVQLGKKTVELGYAKDFRTAVDKLADFLDGDNKELKAINSNRAEKLLGCCSEYLDIEAGSEIDMRTKAGYEIYYLGIPATCSEVDIYKHSRKTHTCIEVKKESDNVEAITLALVMDISKKIDRKGNTMAFVKLSDKTYMLEGLMFSDAFAKYNQQMATGQVALVKGVKRRGTFIIEKVRSL